MCLSDHYLEYQRQLLFCFLKPSLIIIEMKPVLPLTFLLCVHEKMLLLLSDSLFPSSLYLVALLLLFFFLMCQTIGHIQKRRFRHYKLSRGEPDSFFLSFPSCLCFVLFQFHALAFCTFPISSPPQLVRMVRDHCI